MTRSAFVSAMEEILGVPRRTLREQDNRASIEQWNSLADAQIFSLISSEFSVEPDDELLEAGTVADLLRTLQSRGVFRD